MMVTDKVKNRILIRKMGNTWSGSDADTAAKIQQTRTRMKDITMFKGLLCSSLQGTLGKSARKSMEIALKSPKVGPTAPTDMLKVAVRVCGKAAFPMLHCNYVIIKA